MADAKQILVVDDHFEMLEFLRSMLELSNRDFQVLGVPSAEEGFLELRRTPFDLVITDLRLPGMSGFELIRKVQRFRPDIPIIMITGYSSEQGEREAAELGIFRYFQKPLDTDGLLQAVHLALYGSVPQAVALAPAEPPPDVSAEARKRLEALRADTGARQVILANTQGDVLYQSGHTQELALPALAQTIAASVVNSFRLADQIGSDEPFMIHYQSGRALDVYSANVGHGYFVAMFFDTRSRRGRIGTVWVFAQRAIKELLALLPETGIEPSGPAALAPAAIPAPEGAAPSPDPAVIEPQPFTTPGPTAADAPDTPQPADDDHPPPALDPADENELATMLQNSPAKTVDLDAYWDQALSAEGGPPTSGLSLDEARRQGLLPSDFESGPDEPRA